MSNPVPNTASRSSNHPSSGSRKNSCTLRRSAFSAQSNTIIATPFHVRPANQHSRRVRCGPCQETAAYGVGLFVVCLLERIPDCPVIHASARITVCGIDAHLEVVALVRDRRGRIE